MKLNEREQIGWYNETDDLFFCNDCFSRMSTLNKENYKPVKKEDSEEAIYTCNKCGKVFGEKNGSKKRKRKSKRNWNGIIDLWSIRTRISFSSFISRSNYFRNSWQEKEIC